MLAACAKVAEVEHAPAAASFGGDAPQCGRDEDGRYSIVVGDLRVRGGVSKAGIDSFCFHPDLVFPYFFSDLGKKTICGALKLKQRALERRGTARLSPLNTLSRRQLERLVSNTTLCL